MTQRHCAHRLCLLSSLQGGCVCVCVCVCDLKRRAVVFLCRDLAPGSMCLVKMNTLICLVLSTIHPAADTSLSLYFLPLSCCVSLPGVKMRLRAFDTSKLLFSLPLTLLFCSISFWLKIKLRNCPIVHFFSINPFKTDAARPNAHHMNISHT